MIVLGVLISGRGSNLMAIVRAIEEDRLDARVAVVVSNRADAAGLAFAREKGIDAVWVDRAAFDSQAAYENEILGALQSRGVQWVVLAGYMRILGPTLLAAYPDHIVNIHPSLLPAFKGLDVPRRVLESGVSEAGCTVHLVDETLDGGRILAQARVPVLAGDTEASLSARILVEEHRLYPQVLQELSGL